MENKSFVIKLFSCVFVGSLLLLNFFVVSAFTSGNSFPPKANGTWIYDSKYSSTNKKLPPVAGLFVEQLNNYNNKIATAGHLITELFVYGGDMEMYCPQSGCTLKSFDINYYPPSMNNHTPIQIGDSGFRSTLVYQQQEYLPNKQKLIISPIIDGRIDYGYLKGFNQLSPELAAGFADRVAAAVCADDRVDGVQFDLEPFDMSTQNGQYYFYQEIAKDFAGKYDYHAGETDPLHCVDKDHPRGRFFSVFTYSKAINENVARVFNQYHNGYVVDSLYDLGPNPGGTVNTPAEYRYYVNEEVSQMMRKAEEYGVKIQYAIPAAASVHEFASCSGPECHTPVGYPQLDYVEAALAAIGNYKSNPFFLGVDVWGWSQKMLWHDGKTAVSSVFQPANPAQAKNVLSYLGTHL